MARDRKMSSDVWTWAAVIDCAAMTRLVFLGRQKFADGFGVSSPGGRLAHIGRPRQSGGMIAAA